MEGLTKRNVREKMVEFIKTHYADILGDDIGYLDAPGGLEKLHAKYCSRISPV